MIEIAIIEDERLTRKAVRKNIEKGTGSDKEVEVKEYGNAEDFLKSEKIYDIVITDIELPGMNGIELGKRIREKKPDVYLIFLTSYAEFAFESYIIEAYQYILKKDMEERLPTQIAKVIEEIKKSSEEYRWVVNGQDSRKLYYKDIVCIQKIKGSKYTEFVTTSGIYKERMSLNQILDEMDSDAFIMADRGHAINVNYIKGLKGNVVYMEYGEEITVSRVQIAKVKEQITTYWRESK